jgi:2',3'-cyclic-nucleotide 2'-phosphodiesterase (5'-nucleotidase family)
LGRAAAAGYFFPLPQKGILPGFSGVFLWPGQAKKPYLSNWRGYGRERSTNIVAHFRRLLIFAALLSQPKIKSVRYPKKNCPMVLRQIITVFATVLTALAVSCTTGYRAGSVQYKDYRIKPGSPAQPSMTALMKPYADSVTKSMNDVIAVAGMEMEKKQPEGSLGNLLADGMLAMAAKHYGTKVDAAFLNFGGIRLTSIPAGPISRGKVFELLPFDNAVVLQKVSGKTLLAFVNHVAGRGGWPCAGISFQLQNKSAVNIRVGGAPVDELATYTIANNDYVVNGGDDCVMLRGIPQQSDGYLVRTAIIEYLQGLAQNGQPITAKIEKRVSHVE